MGLNLVNKFIFCPMRYPEGDWYLQNRIGARDIELRTADGIKIHAWWFAADSCDRATLFLHGNAGNVTHRIDHAAAINIAGSSVLVIDYRGYGKSDGKPTERGFILTRMPVMIG
jgi:predicted alpha/beta hydrolase